MSRDRYPCYANGMDGGPALDPRQIGENIRRLLGLHLVTQHELADSVGLSKQTVWYSISGRTVPGARHLQAIAHQFGIDIDTLVGDTTTCVRRAAEAFPEAPIRALARGEASRARRQGPRSPSGARRRDARARAERQETLFPAASYVFVSDGRHLEQSADPDDFHIHLVERWHEQRGAFPDPLLLGIHRPSEDGKARLVDIYMNPGSERHAEAVLRLIGRRHGLPARLASPQTERTAER